MTTNHHTVLPLVIEDDSYDFELINPRALFRDFRILASERYFERGLIEQYYYQKIYQLIWASNAMENVGENLETTVDICSIVFEGRETNGKIQHCSSLKGYREVINHAKAAAYILSTISNNTDLSEDIILKTHEILTTDIDMEDGTPSTDYSGKYRRCPIRAGLHQFMHEKRVPSAMKRMIRDYEADTRKAIENRGMDPIALAAKYSHIFVNIHPFEDGNGRMSRLILNAILFKFTCCLVAFGQNEVDREQYRHIVADASLKEQLYELIDFEDVPEHLKPKSWRSLTSFTLKHALETMQEMQQLGRGAKETPPTEP